VAERLVQGLALERADFGFDCAIHQGQNQSVAHRLQAAIKTGPGLGHPVEQHHPRNHGFIMEAKRGAEKFYR
jgi:hypothetical protein